MKKTFNQQSGDLASILVREAKIYKPDLTYAFDLMRTGADIDLRDPSGMTPLMIALKNGLQEIAESLIKLGASMTARTYNGTAVLHLAAEAGMTHVVEQVLAAGADINMLDDNRNSALMLAAANNRSHTVSLLINKDARLGLKNNDGKSAADLALQNNPGKDIFAALSAAERNRRLQGDFINHGMPTRKQLHARALKRRPPK